MSLIREVVILGLRTLKWSYHVKQVHLQAPFFVGSQAYWVEAIHALLITTPQVQLDMILEAPLMATLQVPLVTILQAPLTTILEAPLMAILKTSLMATPTMAMNNTRAEQRRQAP